MSTPTSIDVHGLLELLDSPQPPRLIDVRTAAEFESVHVPGAHNIPLDLLRAHRDDLLPHFGDDVVLICRSGQRAEQAKDTLTKAGLPDLRILGGGIVAWEAAGAPVERGRQRWDLERQVRLVAGTIVLSSVLGSVVVPRLKWVAAALGGGLTTAALTNTCAMGALLSRLPYNRGARIDLETVIRRLATEPGRVATAH